jgi:hypothetical protein
MRSVIAANHVIFICASPCQNLHECEISQQPPSGKDVHHER